MYVVTLYNGIGLPIDDFYIDVDEVTCDDIAERNWCLADGDKITIEKVN